MPDPQEVARVSSEIRCRLDALFEAHRSTPYNVLSNQERTRREMVNVDKYIKKILYAGKEEIMLRFDRLIAQGKYSEDEVLDLESSGIKALLYDSFGSMDFWKEVERRVIAADNQQLDANEVYKQLEGECRITKQI